MCGNDIYSETLSPDGELKAVIFQRDCGATTGFSTQVSILDTDETLENDGGNINLIAIENDEVVKVQLVGACSSCSVNQMTLKSGVEMTIKKYAPEIKSVVNIEV